MSDDDKASPSNKNNWITPTVIAALIGLAGTLLTLYFGYLKDAQSLEATQTADARNFLLTVAALTPTPSFPTATATIVPPTATPPAPTLTDVPHIFATFTPTRTISPNERKFCPGSRSIYVRAGPGTEWGAIGSLTFEDCPYFDGRNPDSSWLRIAPDQEKYLTLGSGWVRSDLVRPQDDISELPVILPPTETPTPEG